VYDGSLPGLAATVGARRMLVVDLAAPSEDLVGVPHTTHVASEAEGLRQRLAFDAEETTAAEVLQAVAARVEVRDLSIEEPDIEDVVRRIYQTQR
jgi:ABC-2 type transport system ATP-binding protein